MTCEAGAFSGRSTVVYYAIACPEAQPTASEYVRLGMMRGKTIAAEWETADATGDMSPAFTTESLTTYKSISFSGDGVTRKEDTYNQNALKRHVYNPPDETGNQPYVWLKILSPNDITEGCFIVSSWSEEHPHDDVSTWSIEATSAGVVDVRNVEATVYITTQPVGATLLVGQTMALTVAASVTDGSVLTYQWKKNGTNVTGATGATYSKVVALADAGVYTCVISSPTAASVVSGEATVVVNEE